MKYWVMILLAALSWGSAVAVTPQDAQNMVHDTADQMLSKLRAEKAVIDKDPSRIYALVNQIVLPHFDFQRMSSWVLGRNWQGASPTQRQQFLEQFRNLLVRTYAKSLATYTDSKISYLPLRQASDPTEVTVRTEVAQPGGMPIPMDYSLYLKGNEWKVYDVVVDGVSLVGNYRTTFNSEIHQHGLDKLIATLTSQNHQGVEK